MGVHLDRAMLLLEQSRYALAEQELRLELVDQPENAAAHAGLAICLLQRERYDEAQQEAESAIHHAPQMPYPFLALAKVLFARGRQDEAARAIETAIALDPWQADFFAQLAAIRLEQRRWADGLAATEQGLASDAHHAGCLNLRAIALVQLGRRKEAAATLADTLAQYPNDATSHANQGWALLEAGDHQQAMVHFREALRLQADHEWARHGIVEALKARHFIYGWLLRYFLWMGKLNRSTQVGLVIGLVIAVNVLSGLARQAPGLSDWAWVPVTLYLVFVYLTWTASSLFNLVLRLDRFGRYALNEEETRASNWVGGVLLAAILSLGLYPWLSVLPALLLALLVLPVAGTFNTPAGWPRQAMGSLSLGLGLLAAVSLGLMLASGEGTPVGALGERMTVCCLYGIVASTWVAAALQGANVQK